VPALLLVRLLAAECEERSQIRPDQNKPQCLICLSIQCVDKLNVTFELAGTYWSRTQQETDWLLSSGPAACNSAAAVSCGSAHSPCWLLPCTLLPLFARRTCTFKSLVAPTTCHRHVLQPFLSKQLMLGQTKCVCVLTAASRQQAARNGSHGQVGPAVQLQEAGV